MKKGLIISLAAALVITLGATLAFAESTSPGMMDKGQMNEIHRNMVEQHVKEGVLTPEQAKGMDEHMANRDDSTNCCSSQQSTDIPQQ